MLVLKRTSLLQYALLAMPLAFAGLPIYLHAPDFYAVNFSLSLAVIGFVLLGLRFIDAVQDPLIGVFSDKYNQHRVLIIVLGLALLTIGFIALFNPPISLSEPNYTLAWMAASVFICTTGFSIVTINMQALGGLWQVDTKQMPRIMSWREAFGLIGLLVGSILPTILLMSFGAREAYSLLSFIFIPIILVSGFIFIKWCQKTVFDKTEEQHALSFTSILKLNDVRKIYIIFLMSGVASAIPATLVLFFIRDYLQAENYTGLFLLLYFLSGVLAMPLWQYIAKKRSPAVGWFVSMILACVVFVSAFFLSAGDVIPYAIICILSGMAIGGDLALPPTIIAEFIKKNRHQQAAGQYYAVSTFISKAALAIATGVALPLLAFYGYKPGTISEDLSLPLDYALVPCAIKLFAAALLWQFILNNKQQER